MKEYDFVAYLSERPDEFEYERGEVEGIKGIVVENKRFEVFTHFSYEAIEAHPLNFLLKQTHDGHNVEHITRVTGFFSKVSAWNKGKRAELQQRHRATNADFGGPPQPTQDELQRFFPTDHNTIPTTP